MASAATSSIAVAARIMLDLLTQDDVYVRWYVSLHARSGLVVGWFVGKSEQVLFLVGWLLLVVWPKVREGKMN